MRQATQLPVRNQLSPRGPCPLQPQLAPSLQDGAAGKPAPRPQQAPPGSEEPPPRQPAVPCHVPRLRAVVESQAFRNILVDEVDMMHARAATLIQANWRGHRLRQKLVSQMTAAKAIQEAWRRFSTRRLRRSSKVTVRRRSEEGDIPYHPPQQVRFGPQPLTASKETPVSASVILEPCAPRPLSLPPPAVQGPPAPGVRAPSAPMAAILLHQAVASSLPCSRSLDPKCQPSLVATNAVRSPCLVSSPVAEDTAQSRCVSSRATKAGAPESPLSGRCCQAASAAPGTQAQVEAEPLRTPAQTYGMASTTRASSRTYAGAAITKPAAQTCPAPTLTRTQPQTCPAPTLTRTQPQTCPAPTLTRTQPQTCPAPTLTRTQPQTCLAPTLTKAPAQAQPTPQASTPPPSQPTALKSRTPTQQGWMPVSTKASALMGLVPALGRGPLQTPPVATVCKTLSQTSPVTSTPKPPSQMSLAAMISRTPAQIRSVTAVLKTLCPTLPAASNLKAAPPAARPAGAPGSSSSLPLAASRTKVPASRREAAAGTAKGSDLSCWAGRRLKGAPQPHLETGAPGAPTRGPLEAKSTHTGAQKPVHKDTACKTDVAMRATKVPSWAGVSKDRSQPLSQTLQRTEVIKVQSQVYMPVQVAVSVPQAQVAVPLTKALAPGRPAKASSQPQAVTRLTAPTRVHPTAKQIKALSQLRLATCPAKAEAQAHPPSRLSKAPSLAHLVTCLSRTQSQVQLGTEAARRVYTAQQSGDFGSKAQSHPLLTGPKASTPSCRLPGTLDSGFRIKPEHRPGKATQGARPTVPEPQGTLVPLLTSAAATHPGCSVEPWGDSKTTRAQLPTPGQAAPSQEDMLASQITALCTELVTALGSQEDLRVLLARTLSQGEVWAALNQVLSKEALGATVAKALPQGMLGLALAKALSWGELGATLSRALSRGELRAELAKAMHSRVTEVLSRALTQEERVALSRALCQGELGAVLSQSLSRAAPRTGAILPKAASKVTSSKMPLPPARVEVRAWDPCLRSPVRLQPSKVRTPGAGVWGRFAAGPWGDGGDGAMLEGPPCLSHFPVAAASDLRVTSSRHPRPLVPGPELLPSRWAGLGRVFSDPHLSPQVRNDGACPAPGLGKLACDANPVVGGSSPCPPRPCSLQPPLGPWQPFITVGIGPSTSRPSVPRDSAPSVQQPHAASRAAPCPGAPSGEGSMAPGRLPGSVGAGQGTPSQTTPPAGQGAACWCQSVGAKKVTPHLQCPAVARGPRPPPKPTLENLKKAQPPNPKQTSQVINKVTPRPLKPTMVNKSQAPTGRGGNQVSQVSTSARLVRVCPQSSTQQEKALVQGLASVLPARKPAASRPVSPLSELVAGRPSVLAQSPSGDSQPCSLVDSGSQSSSSLSTGSLGSMAMVEVLNHPGGGSWDRDPPLEPLLSQELVGHSQRPWTPEETGGAGQRSLSPQLPRLPPAAPESTRILSRTLVSSCLAVSVHWDAERKEGQGSAEASKRTTQGTFPSGLRRTQSLGTKVSAAGPQAPVTRTLSRAVSQPSLAGRAAPSPGRSSGAAGGCPAFSWPSLPAGLTPRLAQPTVSSRVSPGLDHPLAARGVGPGQARKVTLGSPGAQPFNTRGASPGLGQPPPVASRVCPGSHQPPGVSGVNPSLVWPPVASGGCPSFGQSRMAGWRSPVLHHPSLCSMCPSLRQPLSSRRMVFRRARARPCPPVRMSPYLSSTRVANLRSPSQAKQPAAWGARHSFPEPHSISMGGSGLAGSGVHVAEPGQCPPSVLVPPGSGRSYPGVFSGPGQGLDQAPLGSGVGPRDDLMMTGMAPNLQNPELEDMCLEFYQPVGIYEGIPSTAAVPVPPFYQAYMAHRESPGPAWGPGVPHHAWFKGETASMPQGYLAADAFLSLSPGASGGGLAGGTSWPCADASMGQSQGPVADGTAPLAAQVMETGAPLMPQGPLGTSGLAQGLPPAMVLKKHRTSQAQLSLGDLEPSVYQASVPLPMTLHHQLPSMAPVLPSSYHYPGVAQASGMGAAGMGLVLDCEDGVATDAVVPDASGLPFCLPQGSVLRDMGQGLPPGSVMAGVAQGLPPGYLMDGMVQGLPPGCLMDGMVQGLPPGSVVGNVVQGLYPGSMMAGVAQGFPPRSVMGGVVQGLPPGCVMDGMIQGFPPGSMVAGGVAPRQVAACGPGRRKPCLSVGPLAGFVAPRLPPGPEASLLEPQVPLGSMPMCVGCKPSPGSLLVGLSPRPFHRTLAGDGTGAQAARHTTRGFQVPTALSKAPRVGQDPGRRTPGALGDQATLRPGAVRESLPQASGSSREPSPPSFPKAAAWMHDSTLGTGVTCDRGPLFVEGTLPKDQKPPLKKVAPGQASGVAPAPGQALRSAGSLAASDTTPIPRPNSVSSRGPPGACLEAVSWVPGVRAGSGVDRATQQPLAAGATKGPLAFQQESMALTGVGCYSPGTAAASPVSPLSQLAPGSPHLESVARMGSPSPPQWLAAGSMISLGQPGWSWAKSANRTPRQGEAAPRAPRKPASQDRTQSSTPPSPSARKSCQSRWGSLVPELLEGSAVRLRHPQWVQTPAPGSSPRSPSLAAGLLPTGVAQGRGVARPCPGVCEMSLGYESSLVSQWPLSDQTSAYCMSPTARHHKLALTPGVPQGWLPPHFMGPIVSHHKLALTPGVPQGPVDTSTRGGQPWTSTLPSVAVRPLDCAVAPHTPLQPARSPGPWDRVGCTAAATPRPPGDLSLSVQYMEKIVVHAATVIQACARGYLVRRAIRAWHQRATAIQATWRGHRVRRNLAQLYKAATVIQAAWRGHCVRRARAQHMQLPPAWTTPSEARAVAEHRCFQSCQPRACSLCTSLSPRLGSPPSVVMLVGASPRTCHTCGHTLPTRVVHGTGRAGALQAHASRPALQQLWHSQQQWDAAATTIQSAWRGFKARRQLREQQLAARMVQATWRGHYTRSCLTPEALLGTGSPWDSAPGAPSHDPRQLARRSGV